MSSPKTATILLSLFLAATAHADDEVSPISVCTDFSIMAREVMTARQKDKPMSESLPMAKNLVKRWGEKYGLEIPMDEAEKIAAEVVMAAYTAIISTDPFKKETITEFENGVFAECYKEMTSDSEE